MDAGTDDLVFESHPTSSHNEPAAQEEPQLKAKARGTPRKAKAKTALEVSTSDVRSCVLIQTSRGAATTHTAIECKVDHDEVKADALRNGRTS